MTVNPLPFAISSFPFPFLPANSIRIDITQLKNFGSFLIQIIPLQKLVTEVRMD